MWTMRFPIFSQLRVGREGETREHAQKLPSRVDAKGGSFNACSRAFVQL